MDAVTIENYGCTFKSIHTHMYYIGYNTHTKLIMKYWTFY